MEQVPKYIINNILLYVDYTSFLNFGKTCKLFYFKYYFGTPRFIKFVNKKVNILQQIVNKIDSNNIHHDSDNDDYMFCDYNECNICHKHYLYGDTDNIYDICSVCQKNCYICEKININKCIHTNCHICKKYLCGECNVTNKFSGNRCGCGKYICFNCTEYLNDCRGCYRKKCKSCVSYGQLCDDCENYLFIKS